MFNYIQFELLNICNLSCPLCDMAEHKIREPVFFSVDAVKRVVPYLNTLNGTIGLYGRIGEPLLHPNIVPIINAVDLTYNNKSVISTNGMNLNGRLADEISKSPLSEIRIALDGASTDTYSIYRKGGDFSIVLDNVVKFIKLRDSYNKKLPRVVLQFIPMKHNEHEVDKFITLAKDMGCDSVRIKLSGSVSRDPRYKPTKEELCLSNESEQIANGTPCKLDQLYIDCQGNIYPCCYAAGLNQYHGEKQFYLGNIFNEEINVIQKKNEYIKLKREFECENYPKICLNKCIRKVNFKINKIRFK